MKGSHINSGVGPRKKMKHFSITFVEYEEGNLVSFLLAVISLSPIFAVIGHASSLLVKRDLFSICLFIGALGCALLNEVLKHILQQPRPTGSRKDGHGMPSNHSQLSFFFAVSVALVLNYRYYLLWLSCIKHH